MSDIPTNVSESVRRRNPHLYGGISAGAVAKVDAQIDACVKKRLRQSSKPLLNKLETQWLAELLANDGICDVRSQAVRYRLGNGIWYKPDFTGYVAATDKQTAWEVKGPHAFRGGFENLKVAASQWKEIDWILVWRQNGAWQQQKVFP